MAGAEDGRESEAEGVPLTGVAEPEAVRVMLICIGDDRVTLPEGEGEPMATVGAKVVERGKGEAIRTDGRMGDAPHPPPEGVREMGVGESCRGEGGCSETMGVRAGAEKWAKGPVDAPPLAGGGRASVNTVFFGLGLWTHFHAILFPNTTRASLICSSVPRIEMWRSSCKCNGTASSVRL